MNHPPASRRFHQPARTRRSASWLSVLGLAIASAVWGTAASTATAFDVLDQPGRLFDSRAAGETVDGEQAGGGRRGAGSVTEVAVEGRAGVSEGAIAAVVNVTAVNPEAGGFLTVFGCGPAMPPTASTLNYQSGANVANGATVALGDAGSVCVYTSAATHLIVDVTGFEPASSSFGVLDQPGRLFDSRAAGETVDGEQAGGGRRGDGSVTEVTVTGRAGVPSGATAAVLNVTAVNPGADGFLTVVGCAGSGAPPATSTVNYKRGFNVANGTTAAIGADGTLCVYSSKNTELIVDITGFIKLLERPFTTSEGAAAGLEGCLNRPLYIEGSHRVTAEYTRELFDSTGGSDFSTITSDVVYEYQEGPSDDAVYDIKLPGGKTVNLGGLRDSTLYLDGTFNTARGYVANPLPSKRYFDLEVGQTRRSEEVVWIGATNDAGEVRFSDTTNDQTYAGRENVTIDGAVFKACRVETKILIEAPFVRGATTWYAVGSGVILKEVTVSIDPNFPPAGRDLVTTSTLTFATIDGMPIKP